MEGKLHALENRIEGRLSAVENVGEELKADSMGIRQDLKALTKVVEGLARNLERNSEASQRSVNDNREKRENAADESEDDRGDAPPNWVKLVELPTFEGLDPMGWIARAEKFFEVQKVAEREKLRLAFICMEGSANYWYQFWKTKVPNPSWDEFRDVLVCRFGGRERGDVFEKLASIRQRGSVDDYIQELEMLAAQAKGVADTQLKGYFFAGL